MNRRQELNTVSRRWRLSSFVDAGRGLKILVSTQPNARVHSVASAGALALAVWLQLSGIEWAILTLTIACVWVTEGLNTAVEFTVDLVSPEYDRLAGWAKDVAAGAVLVASLNAAVVGAILFVPKLLRLL
ncbi:diacylglycerol kinase family protein [Verrucomicrobiota bacterium sgz303538]